MKKKSTIRKKKGDAEKKYIECMKKNPEGLTRVDIRIKTDIKTSTEADITNRLLNKKIIGKKEIYESGITIIKYFLISLKDLANPEELNFLIELYKIQTKESICTDKLQEICYDIEDICINKKVRDEHFIKFIINESMKNGNNFYSPNFEESFDWRIGPAFHINSMRKCLGYIASNLIESIEKKEESIESITGSSERKLLSLIYNISDKLYDEILNSFDRTNKRIALNVLKQFKTNHKYEIAFKLLEEPQIETDFETKEIQINVGLQDDIRDLILLYAHQKRVDCRRRLYKILKPYVMHIYYDEKGNEKISNPRSKDKSYMTNGRDEYALIQNEIWKILELIRIQSKELSDLDKKY